MALTETEPKNKDRVVQVADNVPDDVSKWEPVRVREKKPVIRKHYKVGMVGGLKPTEVIQNCVDESEAVAEYVKKHKLTAYEHRFRSVEVKLVKKK